MYINGVIATNFTISTTQGASAQDLYSTYNGDTVEFYFNSGNWDTISFSNNFWRFECRKNV